MPDHDCGSSNVKQITTKHTFCPTPSLNRLLRNKDREILGFKELMLTRLHNSSFCAKKLLTHTTFVEMLDIHNPYARYSLQYITEYYTLLRLLYVSAWKQWYQILTSWSIGLRIPLFNRIKDIRCVKLRSKLSVVVHRFRDRTPQGFSIGTAYINLRLPSLLSEMKVEIRDSSVRSWTKIASTNFEFTVFQ